jgi:hypothetical protein
MPEPDAKENRRLGKIRADKAEKMPPGAAQDARLTKARDHEANAKSEDWRRSSLTRPK